MLDSRRRLAAIVAADVAGYSRLMGADEEGTIAALLSHRLEVIEPKLVEHHGRIANTAGDSLLIEFSSAVDALRCMIEVQSEIRARNEVVPTDRQVVFRVGINVGDVVSQGEDLLGDGVNVAARLEGLAPVGGICISRSVRDQVRDRMKVNLKDLGQVEVKNIARAVRVFEVVDTDADADADRAAQPFEKLRLSRRAVALLAAVTIAGVMAVFFVPGLLYSWRFPETPQPEPASAPLLELNSTQDMPSIAVAPFVNLSDDASQDYFADGMTEDITTDLSRVSGLHVPSQSATRGLGEDRGDLLEIAKDLGVGHLLEGSVRRVDDQLRITAKLIDVDTGAQVWAERFDRNMSDVLAIQDEIADRVVSELSTRLEDGSLNRVKRAYTPSGEAYDLYIQGRAKRIPPTPPNLSAALKLFNQSIEADPRFAGGYAGASYVRVLMYSEGIGGGLAQDNLKASEELAEKAVELDPAFGPGWGSLAEVYLRERRFDEALAAIIKAIEMAPNDSLMRASYGRILGYVGRAEDGIAQVRQAMRMSPDSLPMLFFLGSNYRAAGDYDMAIELLLDHRKQLGGRLVPAPTAQLVVAYVQAGRIDDAKREAGALLETGRRFSVELATRTHVYQDPDQARIFSDALQAAGIPL